MTPTEVPTSSGSAPDDDPLLSEREVANMIGVRPRTLSQWRHRGSPSLEFIAIGKFRKYRRSVVLRFLEENARTHTLPRPKALKQADRVQP